MTDRVWVRGIIVVVLFYLTAIAATAHGSGIPTAEIAFDRMLLLPLLSFVAGWTGVWIHGRMGELPSSRRR